MTWYDTNGDGLGDVLGSDANSDGYVEVVYTDSNGDGVTDYVAVDANADGYVETYATDSNHDGTLDTVASDLDLNGTLEHFSMDTDADGTADSFIMKIDRDGDGIFDASATQTSDGAITTTYDTGMVGPTLDGFGPSSSANDAGSPGLLDEPNGPYSSTTHDTDGDLVPDYYDANPRRDEEGYFR